MEVAVVADHLADVADVRQEPQPVAHLLAAAASGASASSSGSVAKTPSISSSIEAERRARVSELGSSGEKCGSPGSEPRALWSRAVTSPSRRARAGSHSGSEAIVSSASFQASPCEGTNSLQQRERRLERAAGVGDVALERGDVLEAPLGEEAQQLELRIHARLDPAVELEREPLVQHDRAVRLLHAHRPDRRELAGAIREALGAPEGDRGVAEPERRPGAHQPDDLPHESGVGDRVVDRPALDLGDRRVAPALVGGPEAEREVVEIVALEAVADLDDPEREDRRAAGRDSGVEHARVEHVARLAAEPALRGDRPEEDEPVEEAQVARLDLRAQAGAHRSRLIGRVLELEPEEAARAEREQVRELADPREAGVPEQLDRHAALEGGEVELDRLRRPGEVVDAEDDVLRERADVGEDLRVLRPEHVDVAEAEDRMLLAQLDEAAQPAEERGRRPELRLDVHGLEAVDGIHQRRQELLREVGAREAAVAVARPLHRRPHAVAVAEVDVVPHRDLVPVVEDGRTREREEDRVHQLDLVAAVVEERGEPAADPDVQLHPRVLRVLGVHVVALLVGDHLERQLVVVAEEEPPLRRARDRGRPVEDLDHRAAPPRGGAP